MRSTPLRLLRRVTIAVGATLMAFSVLHSAPSSAAPLLNGTVTTGTVVPGKVVKLTSDFGLQSTTATRLFNTEVRNIKGEKVGQWVETLSVRKGQRIVRTYDWDTAGLAYGEYVLRLGLALPNWGGTLAWNNDAGRVVLAAPTWVLRASATNTTDGTVVKGAFTAPSTANGQYLLDLEVKDQSGKRVKQWFETKTMTAGQLITLTRVIGKTELPAGKYTVVMGAFTPNWAQTLLWNNAAYEFNVGASAPAPSPSPTTTAAPATTTTTVRPTTTTAAPTTTTPPSSGSGYDYSAGWTLVDSDDFNTNGLNTSKWATYDGIGTAGIGWRSTSAISQSNGEVRITGRDNIGGGMCRCGSGGDQTYGRWEFRAKMDKGNGFGPAILLWPASERWPIDGEIDIFESALGERDHANFTLHYGYDNSQIGHSLQGDFSQWHTWAMEWQPDHITYWIDGQKLWTTTNKAAIPTTPMHMAIQLDAGQAGWWIPGRDANSPAEISLHVDWMKVYK